MRSPRLSLLGLLAGIVIAAAPPALAQSATFSSNTQVVPLPLTVKDASGRFVANLEPDDFVVFDNDTRQAVTFFTSDRQPVSVVLLLDTSASMMGLASRLRSAAQAFVATLGPDDRVQVGAFNESIQLGRWLRADSPDVATEMASFDYDGSTRLFDAIASALDGLHSMAGRRIVVVLTDGEDTDSRVNERAVRDRARSEDVMIYTIRLDSPYTPAKESMKAERTLSALAVETGGGYLVLRKASDFAAAFRGVADELHAQYMLGFTPARFDGRVHAVAVQVKHQGLNVRARRSYIALPAPPPALH